MKLYAQRVKIDLKFEIKIFSSPFPLNPSFEINTPFGKLFYYSIIFVFIFSKISKI